MKNLSKIKQKPIVQAQARLDSTTSVAERATPEFHRFLERVARNFFLYVSLFKRYDRKAGEIIEPEENIFKQITRKNIFLNLKLGLTSKNMIAETSLKTVCDFFGEARRSKQIKKALKTIAVHGRKDACYEKINV